MAFAGSFMATSFKGELLKAVHDFSSGGHSFYMALYDNSQSYGAATTAYSTSGELPNGSGYTTGGVALATNETSTSGTSAIASWTTNPSWGSSASFTTYGAIIYNSSASNKAVCVLDFGGAKTVASGTFTVVLPTYAAGTSIIQIN